MFNKGKRPPLGVAGQEKGFNYFKKNASQPVSGLKKKELDIL